MAFRPLSIVLSKSGTVQRPCNENNKTCAHLDRVPVAGGFFLHSPQSILDAWWVNRLNQANGQANGQVDVILWHGEWRY